MSKKAKKRRPGLGTLVLIGFGLGIACGLFFGEIAVVFEPVGRAYIRLLQMAVIPYIMVSLVAGLGRLTPIQASRIAVWGGAVLLIILASGMVIVLAAPLAYPDWEAASFFSSSLLSTAESVDFVSLYISANPFKSLANTVVPAVVLFSIMLGVAVMISDRKAPLLELLASLDDALINITRFVVKLAPFGIFAISANAAGTLDITAFDKLQVYVATFLLLWAIFFFLLLPGLLIALTPVRYREIFKTFRIPFITAFVTGSVLVVVPMLIERIKELMALHNIADEETDAAVDVLIPTTYNFPSIAMLLALSFIPFAGWYAGSELTVGQYPQFASVGLFVAFGGTNIALPFMLDMFRLPADLFQLFLVANVITNFFFTAVSVMNLVVLTVLTMFLIKRRIKFLPMFLAILVIIGVFGTPLLLKGQASIFNHFVNYEYKGYSDFVAKELVITPVKTQVGRYQADLVSTANSQRLERIEKAGWIKVGYSPDSLPWVFQNSNGDLVGFDMELVHQLAADLGVGLEMIKLERGQIQQALNSGQIDLYTSGLMMDAQLAREYTISQPYADATLGVLVKDHRRQEFDSLKLIREEGGKSFAVLNSPSLRRNLKSLFPELEFSSVDSPRPFLRDEMEGIDALIMSAEAASAWTMVYPGFTVVVPGSSLKRAPFVLVLPHGDDAFKVFINDWLTLATSLRITDSAYRHWILGHDDAMRQPRWSVIRDVLHWVD